MNLQTKGARLERQTGADAIGFCPMCSHHNKKGYRLAAVGNGNGSTITV
jgi:hypothetical protein